MSLAFFIVLDNPEPGFDTFVNGKHLAHCDELEEITQRLGIADIYDYCDGDAEGMYGEDGEEYDDGGEGDGGLLDASQYAWFDPAEGISYFGKIKAYLENDGAAIPNVNGIIEDLDEFLELLYKAAAIDAKWHLQLDM